MEPKLDDEISLKELIEKLLSIWKYLLSKWLLIGVVGLVGAGIGFFMAWSKPVKYTAKINLVSILEEVAGEAFLREKIC
jgi:hypothetical protein